MRRPTLLLHFLLSLAIFLNGVGLAQASVQLPMPHQASSQQAVSHHDSHHAASHDCHHSTAPGHASDSDCCKSSKCQCGCAGHVPLGASGTIRVQALITHSAPPRALALGHAAAALPHLIRPPISQA